MRIRLLVDINGFSARSDGTYFEWPGRGGEVDVEDATARDMINSQQAIPVSTFQESENTRFHDPAEEQRIAAAARETVRPQSPPEVPLLSDSVVEPYLDPPADDASEEEAVAVKRGRGRPRKAEVSEDPGK